VQQRRLRDDAREAERARAAQCGGRLHLPAHVGVQALELRRGQRGHVGAVAQQRRVVVPQRVDGGAQQRVQLHDLHRIRGNRLRLAKESNEESARKRRG
jgi:hypothetical protein